MISVFAGAVSAGMLHVLSGPDHLAAVAPLTLDRHRCAWNMGLRWGLGHSSAVLLVGLLSLSLRELLPLELLSSWAERLVGMVLIGIGIWGGRKALNHHVHVHEHTHDGRRHAHIHLHGTETAHVHTASQEKPHAHSHAAFAVGTLHGLAGSSHFLGILPAITFPTTAQAVGYLAAYGAGTILAMVGFSSAVGWASKRVSFGGVQAYRMLMLGCSVVAMGVGAYWLLV